MVPKIQFEDKAHIFLFLSGLSVIFITIGIIETLLGESVEFFQEVAASRGWFDFDIEFKGLMSQYGMASGVFLLCYASMILVRKNPNLSTKIPQTMVLLPPKAVFTLYLVAFILFIYFDNILLGISMFCLIFTWKFIADVSFDDDFVQQKIGLQKTLFALGIASFSLAITTNYSGALGEFFFQSQWTPTGSCPDRRSLCENMSFGINSLLFTTIQVAFGALLIAVPIGVGCAIFLSEYAQPRLVAVVKPTLEILAGIPSVVYGFFAFIYIGPIVVEFGEYAFTQGWIDEPPNILNPINGAIVVGIMILPLIASMSEDALRAVPNELREGSLALGATKIETTVFVMIQAALSGIIASIILALSRAVGETMAVTLAVGTVAVFTTNMFLPAQTMTAYIAQKVSGDLSYGDIGYLTIFAVGLYLFFITLSLNLLGNKILTNFREEY